MLKNQLFREVGTRAGVGGRAPGSRWAVSLLLLGAGGLQSGVQAALERVVPALVKPFQITSTRQAAPNGPDFYPASQLIDSSGLSDPNPTFANFASVTHSPASSGTTSWVTGTGVSVGGDFFAGPNSDPRLHCILTQTYVVTGMVIWGYDFNGSGTNGNEPRSFRLNFSTNEGTTFSQDSLEVLSLTPVGGNAVYLPFPAKVANAVEVIIGDNHFSSPTDQGGGDRVGFGEIRFVVGPPLVTSNADSGPGTLRQHLLDFTGVSAFMADNTIEFDDSLSGQTINLQSSLPLGAGTIKVSGAGLANGITIRGNGNSSVFAATGVANATLRGLNIRDGFTGSSGGGIRADQGSTLVVEHCAIYGNIAGSGGGIYANGTCTIRNSTISGNTSIVGNSAGVLNRGNMTIEQSTIVGNDSPTQAGIDGNIIMVNSIAPGFTGTSAGSRNNFLVGDPLLSGLANQGGTTLSMRPRPGSPVIDAGDPFISGMDQRGFSRTVGSAVDQGAVELQEWIVNTLADETSAQIPTISLREAIDNNTPGQAEIIRFDGSSVNGSTFNLLTGFSLSVNRDVWIDARGLTDTIWVTGDLPGGPPEHGDIRIMQINPGGHRVRIDKVNFYGGYVGTGLSFPLNSGGAILNDGGTLILNDCEFSDNQAPSFGGGSILNRQGTLTMNGCWIYNSQATFGGGVYNFRGPAQLTRCTVSNCQATQRGGGLYNDGGAYELVNVTLSNNTADARGGGMSSQNTTASAILKHTTVSGNHAGIDSGGIFVDTPLTLNNSIVAGNTSPTGPDIINSGSTVTIEAPFTSLIGNVPGGWTPHLGSGALLTGPAGLSSLEQFGGRLPVRIPLPMSPAIDAGDLGISNPVFTDQRGKSRVGAPDLGAVEYQGSPDLDLLRVANYDEATLTQLFSTDLDGDGNVFGYERAVGSDPFLADNDLTRKLSIPMIVSNRFPLVTFGRNLDVNSSTIWSLQRADKPDGTYNLIYSYDGSRSRSLLLGVDAVRSDTLFSITDLNEGGRAYYKLQIDYVAPSP